MYSPWDASSPSRSTPKVIADQLQGWFNDLKTNIRSDLTTHNAQFFDPATWPDGVLTGVGYTEAPRGCARPLGELREDRRQRDRQRRRQDPQLPVRGSHHLECLAPRSPRSGQCLRGRAGRSHARRTDPALELLRTIHSFNPCMACAVHLIDGKGGDALRVKVC